jgi:hypothetical protein
MLRRIRPAIVMAGFVSAAILLGCEGKTMPTDVDPEVAAALSRLAQERVFFGHQSVGANILDGVRELADAAGVEISISALSADPASDVQIVESLIGRNNHPDEKISEFARMLSSTSVAGSDLALMKFCFVDTGYEMSADEIFSAYVSEMERLEAQYPDITFIYVTMPLTSLQRGPRAWVKQVLGMELVGREDNVDHERFNALLRQAKADTGRLFDLAAVESTHPDGTREEVEWQGTLYPALIADYTDDGGHLNETGRRVVAEQLILFLARVD